MSPLPAQTPRMTTTVTGCLKHHNQSVKDQPTGVFRLILDSLVLRACPQI